MTIEGAGDRNLTIRNITGENEAFFQCPEGSENATFCTYLNSTVWEEVRLSVSCTERKQIMVVNPFQVVGGLFDHPHRIFALK